MRTKSRTNRNLEEKLTSSRWNLQEEMKDFKNKNETDARGIDLSAGQHFLSRNESSLWYAGENDEYHALPRVVFMAVLTLLERKRPGRYKSGAGFILKVLLIYFIFFFRGYFSFLRVGKHVAGKIEIDSSRAPSVTLQTCNEPAANLSKSSQKLMSSHMAVNPVGAV